MKWTTAIISVALLTAFACIPANALDYTIDGPSPGDFGTPTSDETIYVGTQTDGNINRSKDTALIPPDFGMATSYLPDTASPLVSEQTVNGTVSAVITNGTGNPVYPGPASAPSVSDPAVAYTTVSSDLYYSSGHLGTLKIPELNVSVKVYQGTDSATLAKGAGHFANTSIWDGNVCLAAHNRGVSSYFGQIHTLDIGDTVTLTTKLGTRTYAVSSVEKISETDHSMLSATSENCITLFTCVREQRAYRWCVRAVEI